MCVCVTVCLPTTKPNSQQAWVCVLVKSANAGAGCPSPPDLACFVYNEKEESFVYWGRNSVLRLTNAIVERLEPRRR